MSYSNNRYRGQTRSPRSRSPRNNQEFNPSALIKNSRMVQDQPEYIVKHQFNDFAIDNRLKQNIIDCGYITPTPIQDQAIPHILENKDLIGLANTGTGKTAAFLIPLINNLLLNRDKKVLIMTPTRELANQIDSEFRHFSRGLKLFSALCIGGTSMSSQIGNLKRRPHFVIGTPGRLIDLYKRNKLDLNIFSIVVLDEVDRMLDMGFINDMEFVVSKMPVKRQTLFFSATLPHKLDQTVSQFLKSPVTVQTAMRETLAGVNQAIIKINGQSKVHLLQDLLSRKGFDKVLVFGRTKHGLNRLLTKLYDQGFKVAIIHGNKSQNQREKALNQFKNNAVQVLLATDVASRGLDINNVTHVINYDLPKTHEDYIHRIGRTARANKTGVALSFVE